MHLPSLEDSSDEFPKDSSPSPITRVDSSPSSITWVDSSPSSISRMDTFSHAEFIQALQDILEITLPDNFGVTRNYK